MSILFVPLLISWCLRWNLLIYVYFLLSVVSQIYNIFPWLASWIKKRQLILTNIEMTIRDTKDLIKHLEDTLNPGICRGFVDCFLIRRKKDEVRLLHLLELSSSCCVVTCGRFFILLGFGCDRHFLQWEKLDIFGDQPFWCWNWYHSSYITMGFTAYGQVSAYTRCEERCGFMLLSLLLNTEKDRNTYSGYFYVVEIATDTKKRCLCLNASIIQYVLCLLHWRLFFLLFEMFFITVIKMYLLFSFANEEQESLLHCRDFL